MHVETKTGASVELRVNYKRLNTFFADYVKSISRGGTFVGTQRPLAKGTEFLFVLGVPKLEEPLVLGGTVTDVVSPEDATPANPPGMAIEVQYESQAEQSAIRETIETLMHNELGQTLTEALLSRG